MTDIVGEGGGMPQAVGASVPEWKRLTSPYRNYEVSSDGEVRRGVKCLKGDLDRNGYRRVLLSYAGLSRRFRVHRLVCEAFHGPAPEGCEVAHGDGNPSNNRASNLRWATRSENVRDAQRHGTFRNGQFQGERHPNARLTEADVAHIRASQLPHRTLARDMGISDGTVRKIRKGDAWK